MYIAFRWLLILTLFMWLTLCFIDFFVKRFYEGKCLDQALWLQKAVPKNITVIPAKTQRERKFRNYPHRHCDVALLHYLLFFSGAFVGAVYNRKKALLSYAQRKCIDIITKVSLLQLQSHYRFLNSNLGVLETKKIKKNPFLNLWLEKLKETAIKVGVAIVKTMLKLWEFLKGLCARYQNGSKKHEACYMLYVLLVKKVKEIAEERNKLCRILITLNEAHKTLRMRFKTQEIAKSRLVRYIEDIQKQIKENRAKFNTFHRLHMLTEQDNLFLKACIQRLQKEKYEAQKNLWSLVDLIFMSKNNDLQAYCNRFIINSTSRDNSSNAISAEIQRILGKVKPGTSTSEKKSCERPSFKVNAVKSWTSTRITEAIPEEESFVFVQPDEPKLRGLPGECVWTVKNKNGLIEKLYEFECGYKYDSLDTIQRIREYSVYHDKDCLLDFSKNTHDSSGNKFLTESQPFQEFLKNNSEKLVTTTNPRPQLKLLSG